MLTLKLEIMLICVIHKLLTGWINFRNPIYRSNLYVKLEVPTIVSLRAIPHIQSECEEYSSLYYQSHRTLLWIWIMLCRVPALSSETNLSKPFLYEYIER